jgi:superfamily II DNA or RNA helicase
MGELLLTTASHFFKVTRIQARARPAVESFARKQIQMGFQRSANNRYLYTALRVFAAANKNRTEYRFHINQLKQFEEHIRTFGLSNSLVDYASLPFYEPEKAKFKVQSHFQDREHQVPAIAYLSSNDPPLAKLMPLQTGDGKSFVAMRVMQIRGLRTLIIVRPMYIEKWVEDIERTMDICIEDVMVVRGSNHLQALLMLAESDELKSNIIILSNKTMQNWLKLYEQLGEETLQTGYACLPEQLCAHLKIGIRLVDEVHQDFHLQYRIDLYTHVPNSISLSATMISDDDFVNRMYEIAYPAATRYKPPAYKRYVKARAVIYRLKYPNKIRVKDYISKSYSHHLFEQSILKSPETTSNYLKLILDVIKNSYLVDYKEGQRCLVFCASIDMCTVVTNYLKGELKKFDIRRYVEDDPFENLMEADISVSTLLSAGTAVDIANLTTVILTVAIRSSQGNVQGIGRLRELKDGVTPEFYYFVAENIPKHIEYHEHKRVLLRDRALDYKPIFIGNPV